MVQFTLGKQEDIRRAIRHIMVTQPTISVAKMQRELYRIGYQSANGTGLAHQYITKVMRKVHAEAHHYADRDTEVKRVVRMRERMEQLIERLFCIVFWRPEYIADHIYSPSVTDQIAAAKAIADIDIKLYASEKIAGLFQKRAAEIIKADWRDRPMPEEYYEMVMVAFSKHGFPQERLKAIAEDARAIASSSMNEKQQSIPAQ